MQALTTLLMFTLTATAIYCVVQAVRDFRRRNYLLCAAGAACAVLLVLTPIETHAVKLDLPASSGR